MVQVYLRSWHLYCPLFQVTDCGCRWHCWPRGTRTHVPTMLLHKCLRTRNSVGCFHYGAFPLKNPHCFPQTGRWSSLCFSLSAHDTPLAVSRVCHQNNTRQMLLTAGVYQCSQQVSSPAADKKNKYLPKKMKVNAKMSHRFPVLKNPFLNINWDNVWLRRKVKRKSLSWVWRTLGILWSQQHDVTEIYGNATGFHLTAN